MTRETERWELLTQYWRMATGGMCMAFNWGICSLIWIVPPYWERPITGISQVVPELPV